MVAMLEEGRPNPFCKCAIVGVLTTLYIVMCDTPPLRGVNSAWLGGVEFFREEYFPLWGG